MKRVLAWVLSVAILLSGGPRGALAQDGAAGSVRLSDVPVAGPAPFPSGPQLPPSAESGYGSASVGGYGSYVYRPTSVEEMFKPQFRVDTRGGQLYGYDEGYTSVGGFVPWEFDDAIVFMDARGSLTNQGKGGANVGGGIRYFDETLNRIFGVSLWYDFDAGHIHRYHQAGISLESLGRYFDWRVNGYLPVGETHYLESTQVVGDSNTALRPFFLNNSLFLNRISETETAFHGFDTEVGGPMPFLGKYGLNGYVGMYFYTARGQGDFVGVSGRLQAQINEDLTIGVQATDDHKFGSNAQIQVGITLPDGKSRQWLRPLSVRDRLVQPVVRNYRVTAEHKWTVTAEQAINPKDNEPYFFTHVDPNAAANGDGTFARPYNNLASFDTLPIAQKSAVDVVYVSPLLSGDSANPVSPIESGITLLSCQRLLSTSLPHQIASVQGTYTIPRVDLLGVDGTAIDPLPILRNSAGGNVVNIADGANMVEVSGFHLQASSTGDAIFGTNNRNLNINRNTVNFNTTLRARNGFQFLNLSGTSATGESSRITQNTILNTLGDGIRIANVGSPPLEVDLQENVITSTGGNGISLSADSGSNIEANIANVVSGSNQQNGVQLTATNGSRIGGRIVDSNFSSNIQNGVLINADASTIDFNDAVNNRRISRNVMNSNAGTGLQINGTNNSVVGALISGNAFGQETIQASGNGDDAIRITMDSGSLNAIIGGPTAADGNFVFGNIQNGVVVSATGTTVGDVTIQNNIISLAGGGAGGNIFLTGHDVDLHIGQLGFDNVILDFLRGATPAANYDLAVIGSGVGIWSFSEGFGTQVKPGYASTTFYDTNALAATPAMWDEVFAADGIIILSHESCGGCDLDDAGVTAITAQRARFTQAINSGVDIWANAGADNAAYYDFLPPTIVATGAPIAGFAGFTATAAGTAIGITDAMINGFPTHNRFTSAAPQFTVMETRGTEIISLGVQNATLNAGGFGTSVGQDGVSVQLADSAQLNTLNISNNQISGYGENGVHVVATGNAQAPNVVIDSNSVVSSGNGYHIQRADSATINGTFTNNVTVLENIVGNTGAGLRVTATGTNVGGVTLTSANNDLRGNQNGWFIQGEDDARITINSVNDSLGTSTGDNLVVNALGNSNISISMEGASIDSAAGNGLNLISRGTSTVAFALSQGTSISSNVGNGLLVDAGDSSLLALVLDGASILNNGPAGVTDTTNATAGLNVTRTGSSLVRVDVLNSSIINNTGDGIQITMSGSDPSNPIQPLSGTPNRINIVDSFIDSNGRSGVSSRGFIDVDGPAGPIAPAPVELISSNAVLVMNAFNSSFSGNGINGVEIDTGNLSAFGNPLTGERSIFSGITATENGNDGLNFYAFGQMENRSRHLIEINANEGNTLIADNGGDGIHTNVPYGFLDLIVAGDLNPAAPAFTTTIARNAQNGILVEVSDQLGAADDDSRGGFFADGPYGATANILIRDVIVGGNSASEGNGVDGIRVDIQDGLFEGNVTLDMINVTSRFNGRNGLNIVGDADNVGGLFGGLYNVNVINSRFADNGFNGVQVDLDGEWGQYSLGLGRRLLSNSFRFDSNVIQNNGVNGFSYISNAGAMTGRASFTNQAPDAHISVDFIDPQPTAPVFPFDVDNIGVVGYPFYNYDATGIADRYLNIATDSNSTLVFTRNQVLSNGNNANNFVLGDSQNGHGMLIRVGTNTYLAADIGGAAGSGLGNTFTGNANSDVRFQSFISGDATRFNNDRTHMITTITPSIPRQSIASGPVPDIIFLDDTAQLDLRFNGNTGNSVTAGGAFSFGDSELGAAYYTLNDVFKGGVPRLVQLFQVDGSPNLNANNNFQQSGVPVDIFGNLQGFGEFHMRALTDPLFPNIDFAQGYPTDPGDPWLP